MRSYALFLALAVLHARAATIPAPETEKKLPIGNDALDDVSLDNNEQEPVNPSVVVKDVENNLRNSIPENVPVKIIEEQPIIKTIPLKEDSNDYVPDNDDSTNIKRVEIDLKNPGPPQRQEHDSQKPVPYSSYVDKERAVAAIRQSIAESQNIFSNGIKDVTQKFQYYFANNDELTEVSKNIQSLRKNFDAGVVKLSNTINSYLKPEHIENGGVNEEVSPSVKEVENRLKSLETNFNYGVGMLSEGVELLSILKEEDEQMLKISGKADTGTAPAEAGTSTGTAPANPAPAPAPSNPTVSNPVFDYIQNLNNSITNAFTNLGNTIQNFFNPNQNQNQNLSANPPSQGGFNPANLFQGISIPNIFQQNPNQQPQEAAPAGTQSDVAASTERPNIFQQIQNTFQSIVNPGQGGQQPSQPNQNPITQFFSGVNQGITNLFQPRPGAQQTPPQANQPAAAGSQPAPAVPAAAEGTNSVPVAPAQADPPQPVKQSEPVNSASVQSAPVQSESAQNKPIQQIVQNNPIVKGITNAVQKIQSISNPNKPRDTDVENPDPKGHGSGGAAGGDSISGLDDIKKPSVNEQPQKIPEIQDGGEPAAELNKTE